MGFKYYLYRLQWWLADKTPYLPDYPLNLDLELAGKCNLSCTMCPYGTGAFDEGMQGMMPSKMAERALQEARRLGTKSVKFNFRGEPGLSKHLESLVQYAKALGYVDIFINTNMLAFSGNRIKKLAESGLTKLIVSVDGGDKQAYEKIRVGGKWGKLVDNIKLFNQYRKNTKLIVQTVGKEEVDLSFLCADKYKFVKVQDRGQGDEKREGKRRRCPQPRQRLVVAWDGTIFACCSNWNNEYPLGNYNKISLKTAWESEEMNMIRQISTKCNAFPCQDCQVSGSWK